MQFLDIDLLNDKNVLNIYLYGSRVYNSNSNNSDYDFIIIVDEELEQKQITKNIDNKVYEYSIYGKKQFNEMILNHHITAMECFFLSEEFKIKETYILNLNLDKYKMRESLSKTASNSWVKAKKKLTVEKDFNLYIAQKSLFHSLRILLFGIQIAKYNKIIDYTEADHYLNEIIQVNSIDWNDYKTKYQGIYNNLKSQFRLLVPKSII